MCFQKLLEKLGISLMVRGLTEDDLLEERVGGGGRGGLLDRPNGAMSPSSKWKCSTQKSDCGSQDSKRKNNGKSSLRVIPGIDA